MSDISPWTFSSRTFSPNRNHKPNPNSNPTDPTPTVTVLTPLLTLTLTQQGRGKCPRGELSRRNCLFPQLPTPQLLPALNHLIDAEIAKPPRTGNPVHILLPNRSQSGRFIEWGRTSVTCHLTLVDVFRKWDFILVTAHFCCGAVVYSKPKLKLNAWKIMKNHKQMKKQNI